MSEAPNAPGWIEVASAVVLALAGLATSWSGYQSALWDGEQAAQYSRAGALRVTASRERLESDALAQADLALFSGWLDAVGTRNAPLADFYHGRFRPGFRPAFERWRALDPAHNPDAPATPFVMDEYRPQGRAEAAALERRADATFEAGQRANDISDAFVQATVILATAMFFAGIGQVFRQTRVRIAVAAAGALACVVGLARVLTLPILGPG